MLQHSIGKEEILHIANSMIADLDPLSEQDRSLMASGLQLYREGRVYNVSTDGFTIEGTVEDDRVQNVSLPIQDVSESYCDCFRIGYCEHMIAVLFYSAASFGQVGEITKRFKEKGKPALPQVKTAKQLLQQTSYEEMDYDSWISYLEQEYEAFVQEQKRHSYRQMYFTMSIFEDFYMKMLKKAPRLPMLRELFELNAALFSFERLLDKVEELEANNTYSYYKPVTVAHRLIEEIELFVHELSAGTFPIAYDDLLRQTAAAVHHLLFKRSSYLQEQYFIYRYIWSELLKKSAWMEDESARIAERDNPTIQSLASAHILFLQKKDQEARAVLAGESDMLLGLYFYWLEELSGTMQWERMDDWLSFVYKRLKQYIEKERDQYVKRDIVRLFLSSYSEYSYQTNEYAGYEVMLHELLPFSFWEYDSYLLAKRQYKTWAELRLFVGFDTLNGMKDSLKEVEKADREAVLPLYHQGVVQAVAAKNRPSYKLAVRYLKKLRTHYKKLKRTEEWDAYIVRLSQSFSRLRAFQEELRKGKLIDE